MILPLHLLPFSPHLPYAPSLCEAIPYWFKLGLIDFGHPAGKISIMHREMVGEAQVDLGESFPPRTEFLLTPPLPRGTAASWIGLA